MIEKKDIIELRARVSAMQRPILSLYADVHPGRKETLPQSVLVRLKNTLRELPELPQPIADKVLSYFEARPPSGRSLAVFANEQQLEAVEFDAMFIDDSASDRLDTRFGDPYLTPLVAAMNEHEPYAIVWADRDNVRVFELFMDQAEQLFQDARQPVAGEATEAFGQSENRMPQGVTRINPPMARSANTVGNKQSGPKFIADRGDAAKQLAHEHVAHAQNEFYGECGKRLREAMVEHGLQHVVILGPDRDRHAFLSALPRDVSRKVGALASGNSKPPVGGREIVELVRPIVAKVEGDRKRELLHAIEESGVHGVEESLAALQQGRAHTVAVAKSLDRQVFVDEDTSYVSCRESGAKSSDAHLVHKVRLADHMPELAERWGAQLTFLHGNDEQELTDKLGGMGVLLRW